MENEQKENLVVENNDNKDDINAFGPHNIGGRHFFTTLYKEQNIKNNPLFIKWKKDMKEVNDLIIHCPKCNAYFPNAAYTNCCCEKCEFFFCFGCFKENCRSKDCIKWWKIIIPFFGLKEYGDRNFFLKALMFFFMLFQVWFTFPLQILYKLVPRILGEDGYNSRIGYEKYRKKGISLCLWMLPYQIAYIMFWFNITSILFVIPGILYPPYPVYWMGIFWYVQTHFHGGLLYEGDGKYY